MVSHQIAFSKRGSILITMFTNLLATQKLVLETLISRREEQFELKTTTDWIKK